MGCSLPMSSTEVVAREESPKRIPFSRATAAPAFSPRVWNIRCPAVGHMKKGRFTSRPKILVFRSSVSGELPAKTL